MTDFQILLHDWQVFFQMSAECSATLIGLMFVVVTQSAMLFERRMMKMVHTFLSPILGYYIQALLVAALLCIPNRSAATLQMQILVLAVLRTALWIQNFFEFHRYHRLRELPRRMWFHHFLLPVIPLPFLLGAVATLPEHPGVGMDLLAAAVLLAIILGILEAWRLILLMAAQDPQQLAQLQDFEKKEHPEPSMN